MLHKMLGKFLQNKVNAIFLSRSLGKTDCIDEYCIQYMFDHHINIFHNISYKDLTIISFLLNLPIFSRLEFFSSNEIRNCQIIEEIFLMKARYIFIFGTNENNVITVNIFFINYISLYQIEQLLDRFFKIFREIINNKKIVPDNLLIDYLCYFRINSIIKNSTIETYIIDSSFITAFKVVLSGIMKNRDINHSILFELLNQICDLRFYNKIDYIFNIDKMRLESLLDNTKWTLLYDKQINLKLLIIIMKTIIIM
uniref:T-complex protein eta SU n=1 Tax=Amorphochlora amoebiformis TaxID=1561963 RepID=A0A0H5BQY1_9EUKA|nr:T-complex protein eta SU [Amorphochlora amoebiformis]